MTRIPVPVERPGLTRRIAPAVGLFLLAPLVGEYLLGNIPASEIAGALFLAPMYGGGAILIREVVRRTGRGWPSILVLGAAYGLLEAGLLDQSLFNPSFIEDYDFQNGASVPALGISGNNALAFVGGHAIWSIGVPIAIVEALVPHRGTTPWLGRPGLAVTCVVFVLGSAALFQGLYEESGFLASTPQRVGTVAVLAVLIGVAFAIGRRPRPAVDRRAPNPWLAGVAGTVAAGLFFSRPESWWGVAMGLGLVTVMTVVIIRWSRCDGWGAAHRLALAGGALLTYCWGGFVLLSLMDAASTVNLIGQALLVLGAVALLFTAGRITRNTLRKRGSGHIAGPGDHLSPRTRENPVPTENGSPRGPDS